MRINNLRIKIFSDGANFKEMINSLNKLAETYNLPIFFPAHPRTRNYINKYNIELNNKIKQ